MMNPRPLSMRNKVRLLIALTILAWATQTLFHQWGFGQVMPGSDASAQTVGAEHFVPQSAILSGAGTLELRGDATVYGPQISLKQLCRWSDSDAAAFAPVADLVISRFDKGRTSTTLTLDDVRSTLGEAGVNLAVIRFAGATTCTVTRGDAATSDGGALQEWIDDKKSTVKPIALAVTPAVHPILASTVSGETAADAECNPFHTLRQRLMIDLSQRLNLPAEKLQVSFDPKDTNLLNLAEPNFRFDVQPRRVRDLGEVSWDVAILTDGGDKKVPVVAHARAWENQLVLSRPVSYKQVLRDEDVTERRVLVDHLDETPVLNRQQVLGQEAARDLQTGMVMTARMVESVPLAKAGQYVTVTLSQGTVQVKTVAKAMEAGSYGQSIKVRNEATKDIFDVTLTGPQAAIMGPSANDAGLASSRD